MGMVYFIPHSCVQVLCDHFLDTLLAPRLPGPDARPGLRTLAGGGRPGAAYFQGWDSRQSAKDWLASFTCAESRSSRRTR